MRRARWHNSNRPDCLQKDRGIPVDCGESLEPQPYMKMSTPRLFKVRLNPIGVAFSRNAASFMLTDEKSETTQTQEAEL